MTDIPESPATPPRSREATRAAWAERLRRFAESGLGVLDFCRQEAIASQSFYYWKRKVRHEATGQEYAMETR